ncbi:hypothetical protein BDF22DRAFT_743378 [Syncephalis plumigaleata]|nr:hypothetical protein BDF22DRAFT_743378 [Syncephalis plumigaleata]
MSPIQQDSLTVDHVALCVDEKVLNKHNCQRELDETSSIVLPLLPQIDESTNATTIDSPSNTTRHLPSSYLPIHRDKSRGPPSLQCCILTKIILAVTIGLWVSIVVWQVVLVQRQEQQQQQQQEQQEQTSELLP